MTTVSNMLPHRMVAVRTGGSKKNGGDQVVEIPVGESRDVANFDASDPFHKGLLDAGHITTGKSSGRRDNSQSQGEDLQANLTAAQRAVGQAEDLLTAAKAKKEAEGGDTSENRKALSLAAQAAKTAREDLAAAEKAFSKGS